MLRIEEIELENLHPWEHNPRINDHAVEAVAQSISSFGFNVPVICDQNHTIVAGHTRWKAARKLGMASIPVIVIELSETQRRAFAVADNKTAEIADWDFPKLRDILEELKKEDFDIKNLGFSSDEIRHLLFNEYPDENELPAINADIHSKQGDIYELGNHRLLCGDSRNFDDIKLLIGDSIIDHVFGGPPYYNQREYAQWNEYSAYLKDMKTIIENCRNVLKDGGVIAWNIGNDCGSNLDLTSHNSKLLEEAGLKYLDTIAWVKSGANYSSPRNYHIRRNSVYYPAFQWEAVLVYQKPGDMPKMTREAMQYMLGHHTNVWEISQVTYQKENFAHPAVCPVEIPYRSMLAYSGERAYILEPFGGSGTTLVAAEKACKKAFIIERNPAYCDAIIKRWESYASAKANLLLQNN